MRVILEIEDGLQRGHRCWLNGQGVLRIGRSRTADFVIDSDNKVSDYHFEVQLTPTHCVMRDLQSSNGTFHNGQRILETHIANGETITAGETNFCVRLDGVAATATKESATHATLSVRQLHPEAKKTALREAVGNQKITCAVEQCKSGMQRYIGESAQLDPILLATSLAEIFSCYVIVNDLRKFSLEEVDSFEHLYDWLDLDVKKSISPVVLAAQENKQWKEILRKYWGQGSISCLFTKTSKTTFLGEMQNAARGSLAPEGVCGVGYPGVLEYLLKHDASSLGGRIGSAIEAVLIELSEHSDKWQVFANDNIAKVLNDLAGINSNARSS